MSGYSELSPEEKEALKAVGVDPDAKAPPIIGQAQVDSNEIDPSWSAVAAHARRELPPVALAGFFRTPQPDLEDNEGNAMTPAAWLASGKDATAVISLIVHL